MTKTKFPKIHFFCKEILTVVLLIIAVLGQKQFLPAGLYLGFLLMPLIFLVPGLLLLEILSPQPRFNFFQKLAIGFGLSLGIGVAPVFLAFGLKLSINQFAWFYLGLIVVLLILELILKLRRKSFSHNLGLLSGIKKHFKKHPLVLTWGIVGILGFLLIYIRQAFHYQFLHFDNWIFLTFLKRFIDQPFLSSTDPVMGSQNIALNYSYNVYLGFQALLSKISGVTPADLLQFVLPIWLMVISLIVFYLLGRSLIKNTTTFVITFVLFLGYLSIIRCQDFFIRLPEVKFAILFAAIPLVFYLVIQFLKSRKTFWLIILGIVFLGVANAHVTLALATALLVAFLVGLNLVLNWKRRKINWLIVKKLLIFSFIFLILFTPAFLYQNRNAFSTASMQNQVFSDELGHMHRFNVLGHQFYVLDSRYLIDYPYGHARGDLGLLRYLKILILVLALSFLPKLKKSITYQYLFVAAVISTLLVFTPGVTELLGKIYPVKIFYRFMWFIPEALILGVFGGDCFALLKKQPRLLKRIVLWGTLIILGGVVFYGTAFFERHTLNNEYDAARFWRKHYGLYIYQGYPNTKMLYPSQNMQLIINYLNKNSRYNERVMMSNLDSIVFVPNIANYVVAGYQWNKTGYFIGDLEEGKLREKDMNDFFATPANLKLEEKILKRYHPVWIISESKLPIKELDLKLRAGRFYLYFSPSGY